MSWIPRVVAFLGGVAASMIGGTVAAELTNWLREWDVGAQTETLPISADKPGSRSDERYHPGMRRKRHAGDTTLLGRGHHYAWEKIRRAILRRDMWRCEACGRPAEVVDHITPGGTDAWDNLQALCGPCHRVKTLAEFPSAVAGQQRLIHGDKPLPLPAPSAPVLLFEPIRGDLTKK